MPTSLEDYRDVVHTLPPNAYKFLVRTASGAEFSIHKDRESAEKSAAQVRGTVHAYEPTESQSYVYIYA